MAFNDGGGLVMSNSEKYNAPDMLDMATLIEADMQSTSFMIDYIKKRLKSSQSRVRRSNHAIALHYLEQAVDLYQYVAECRLDYHSREAERLHLSATYKRG